MGAGESRSNGSKVYDEALRCFNEEEREKLGVCFETICNIDSKGKEKNKKEFHDCQLEKFLRDSGLPSTRIQQRLIIEFTRLNTIHHKHAHHNALISYETFIICLSQLLKGSADEQAGVLLALCDDSTHVTSDHIREVLNDIADTYANIVMKTSEFESWKQLSFAQCDNTRFVDFLLNGLINTSDDAVSADALNKWMIMTPLVGALLEEIFGYIFLTQFGVLERSSPRIFPECTVPLMEKTFSTSLNIPSITFLNHHIPLEYRNGWRLLFSTAIHGESFSTMLKLVVDQGPTIVVVKDENDHIFGGFNTKSWHLNSRFFGDDSCFLFSIRPNTEYYPATGYTDNFCYLNTHQQTLPNGMGFGGLLEVNNTPVNFFGLWIDYQFGKGKSQAGCTTYNSPMLSANEQFLVKSLEVWAVGESPVSDKKKKKQRSVLDVDPEVQAILEMAGKHQHSEGLREPEPVDE